MASLISVASVASRNVARELLTSSNSRRGALGKAAAVVPGPRVCGFKAATACAAPVAPRSLRRKRQSGRVPLAAAAAAKDEAWQSEAERADVAEVTKQVAATTAVRAAVEAEAAAAEAEAEREAAVVQRHRRACPALR